MLPTDFSIKTKFSSCFVSYFSSSDDNDSAGPLVSSKSTDELENTSSDEHDDGYPSFS